MNEQSKFLEDLTDEQRETVKIMLAMGPRAMERVSRIAEEDKQREWLFTLVRKTSAWVFGVVAALVVFRDNIASLWKGGGP